MITLNFDEVLERTYNAKKGVDVRYGLGQGFEYCKQFADEAQGYAANAKASEKKATDAVAGIEQTKTDAVQAVQNAQTTATNAVQQAQSTATTAVTTKQTEAVQAVGTAQTGAVKAVDDERDAALQQVESSTATAKGYAESAASAANAAGNAATAAGDYASSAESSATAASGSASAAAESESNAASSAQSAETDADRAEAAAELAGTRANTDKTLKTENAPADAAATGAAIAKCKTDTLLAAYPVGSLYMSAEATSPASLFGGTWEQIKDRFILAAGDTYAAGSTGGEETHALTVNEMPNHNHEILIDYESQSGLDSLFYKIVLLKSTFKSSQNDTTKYSSGGTYATGGSAAHNNMPPYTAMYVWKRIA